jgi:hypothetical protein
MSGSAVLIIGGTRDSVDIFSDFALRASAMKRSTSSRGRLVESIAELASAILRKLRSASWGLTCCTIAFITHFWRAIRE